MSIEKRLIEIKQRAIQAEAAADKKVLNAVSEGMKNHFISIGGELDSIILLATDALEQLDKLKRIDDETTNT